MKSSLDDSRIYKQLDTLDIYDSFSKMGRQFESGWHDAQFANIGFDFSEIKTIILAGMGGSNLSAKLIQSISPLILTTPFEIVANYRLPAYAGKETLVILSSYSGNTEEVLSCAQDAIRRDSKVVAITSGGKLKDFSITEHIPLILLDEKFNPCHVPRSAIGIMTGALTSLLVRLNQKAYANFDTKEIARTIERSIDLANAGKATSENPAKTLAEKHKGQGIIIISANHLEGVAQVAASFINETAKTFSTSFSIPNINHHLLEGMEYPLSLKDNVSFLILNSSLYPEIIQKRIQLTKDILLKQKYRVTVIKPESEDLVLQIFESLVFLVMFSYYLGIVHKVDPGTNPLVDHFKKQLFI